MSEPNLAATAQDSPGAGPGGIRGAPGGSPRGGEDGASKRFRCEDAYEDSSHPLHGRLTLQRFQELRLVVHGAAAGA